MIWGTVLTTLFSNLLVPGVYVFRVLDIRPRPFLCADPQRPGGRGGWRWSRRPRPARPGRSPRRPRGGLSLLRWLPLRAHLAVGCLAYAAGYLPSPPAGPTSPRSPAGSAAGSRRGRRGEGGRMTDFTDRKTDAVTFRGKLGLPIHRWYRLTPSFSPRLADDLADHFGLAVGDSVLDPFSGLGTVPLCMKYRGVPACSIEINPYLDFVGTVKTRTYHDVATIRAERWKLKRPAGRPSGRFRARAGRRPT